MKTTILLLAICACTMASTLLQAQTVKPALSIGLETAVPTGNLSLITPLGVGASARLVLPVSKNIGFTVSAGYLYFLQKSYFGQKIGGFHSTPFKGGIRFLTHSGFYFEPQAGYTSFGATGDGDDGGSDGGFTYAGNIGYMAGKKFDISAGFESSRIDGLNFSQIGIRLAYNFSLSGK